jgi:hypothetical protein
VLPDYPGVKAELAAWLQDAFQQLVDHHLGPLRRVRRSRLFQGDAQVLTRPSGREDPTEFREAKVSFTIRDDELPTITLQSILERMEQAAREMARQIAEDMYRTITKTVEQVGNVVNAKGQRISAELILETLSKIQIDFNPDGTARMPEVHIHPDLAEAANIAEKEFKDNTGLRKQFKQIMETKREEWRAREANRRLVG